MTPGPIRLSVLVLLGTVAPPGRPDLAPDRPIAVRRVPSAAAYGTDPAVWRAIPPEKIGLGRQELLPPYGGGSVPHVLVRAVHDGRQVVFQAEWPDDAPAKVTGLDSFRDGVALEFPLAPGDPPGPLMGHRYLGSPASVVNIWYYRADRNAAEDLNAAGIGTLQHQARQDVAAQGRHDGQAWRVAFRRALATGDDADARFGPGRETWLNAVVWNGDQGEHAGQKNVSVRWRRVRFAP